MNELAIQILFRIGVASVFLTLSGIVAAVLLAGFRCKSPAIHRAAWSLVLLQGVLFVQVPISIPWYAQSTRDAHAHRGAIQSPTVLSAMDGGESRVQSSVVTPTAGVARFEESAIARNWAVLLLAVWAGGALCLLGRWVMRYIEFIRNSTCAKCDTESWCKEWEEIIKDCNVKKALPLYTSRSVGPVLCRWPGEYRIIVPHSLWRKLTPCQRKSILRHELAHFERSDLGKALVANLLALVHWFNPMAWFAVRRFEDSIEWTCDDIVEASSPGSATHYAKALLSIGEHHLQGVAWTSAIFGGGLADRIRRLLSPERRPDSRLSAWLPIGMLVGLLLASVIRVELVAQETEVAVDNENHVATNDTRTLRFFVVPVETEFQRSRSPEENVVAYANIDITPLIGADSEVRDIDQFDSEALEEALKLIREKSGPGTLWFDVDYGTSGYDANRTALVKSALERICKVAGFENVRLTGRWSNEDTYQWKGLPEVKDAQHDEPRLGNDAIHIYLIRSPLGKYLGGADCFIKIVEPISLDAQHILSDADKATIRDSLRKMEIPEEASVRIHVALEIDDLDAAREIPQIKQGAEFHRSAVDFLQSAGFNEVFVDVEAPPSVLYTSRYE